jgi:guanylate kinase
MTYSLKEAREQQSTYTPAEPIVGMLRYKVLVAVVGPSGVGKSTTMDEVSQIDGDFGRTGSIVTREPHERDDLQLYRYVTLKTMLNSIHHHDLIQYIIHPTTGHIYATDLAMYSHTYNMLDALPSSIQTLRQLSVKKLVTVYMVTEPSSWKEWFKSRYPTQSSERKKRAREAVANLEWSIAQPQGSMYWLENVPDQQTLTAAQLIDITKHSPITPDLTQTAAEMLAIARTL